MNHLVVGHLCTFVRGYETLESRRIPPKDPVPCNVHEKHSSKGFRILTMPHELWSKLLNGGLYRGLYRGLL